LPVSGDVTTAAVELEEEVRFTGGAEIEVVKEVQLQPRTVGRFHDVVRRERLGLGSVVQVGSEMVREVPCQDLSARQREREGLADEGPGGVDRPSGRSVVCMTPLNSMKATCPRGARNPVRR
jgi:hypothetical protein